ncbi:MAG: hypothetical protein V4760_16305 [Bdellovibrionota bacterium]
MSTFQPRDPFPLQAQFSASEARDHAVDADRWLGLRVDEIEAALAKRGSREPAPSTSGDKHQLWFGLSPRDLLTPYFEIRRSLSGLALEPGMSVVDLGAAYGRMGFVLHRHEPGVRFLGYEYVGERVRDGRRALERFGATLAELHHADLTSPEFKLPQADVYFIYDYGTPKAIEKTLFDLKRVAAKKAITIVARGRACRYSIESRHGWLAKADPAAGETAITIYRSRADAIEAPMQYGVEIVDRRKRARHDRDL